jgi:hypothetical protein
VEDNEDAEMDADLRIGMGDTSIWMPSMYALRIEELAIFSEMFNELSIHLHQGVLTVLGNTLSKLSEQVEQLPQADWELGVCNVSLTVCV